MQYSMAKQKRLWTKKTGIEKGRHKDKNKGGFDCIGLEGQTRSTHADQHKPTTRRKFL
jgi:hypothetical protein